MTVYTFAMQLAPWWRPAWIALCEKWEARGYESLSADEKVWMNVRALIDAVENGGVTSFYYNSGADTLADAMAALRRLGAHEVAAQIERVNRLFPGGVPTSIDARNAVIDSWDGSAQIDRLIEEVDEKLMPMFQELELSLEQFVRQQGLADQV